MSQRASSLSTSIKLLVLPSIVFDTVNFPLGEFLLTKNRHAVAAQGIASLKVAEFSFYRVAIHMAQHV